MEDYKLSDLFCAVLCTMVVYSHICTLTSIQLLPAIGEGMGIYTSERNGNKVLDWVGMGITKRESEQQPLPHTSSTDKDLLL